MSILHAIILGFIQGLSEFLPISSSGHLALFQGLFNISEGTRNFNVILHIGTLIPVCVIFFEEIWALIRNPFQKMTLLLIVGTIPTVIIALLFSDIVDGFFSGQHTLGFNFILTGLVLLYSDWLMEGSKEIRKATPMDACFIGVFQGIALLPAISRSGMTISASLFRGFSRKFAAKFSFLLSIPAILGALTLTIKDMLFTPAEAETIGLLPTAAGFLSAAISGIIAIRFMYRLIQKGNLRYFSYYVFILGGFLLINDFWLHLFSY